MSERSNVMAHAMIFRMTNEPLAWMEIWGECLRECLSVVLCVVALVLLAIVPDKKPEPVEQVKPPSLCPVEAAPPMQPCAP